MISLWELIDPHIYPTIPIDHQLNLQELHYKLNLLRSRCPHLFVVNNSVNKARGYRMKEVHLQLYEKINAKRQADGLHKISVPMESMHLIGAAADILDPAGVIQRWVLDNLDFIEWVGLWFEDFHSTIGWVHAQIYPPRSAKRFFIP